MAGVKAQDRILIVGPSWVGDMVMAQALFMVLRTQHPSTQIDVLAPGWSLPLLARMPEVARGITMPLGHGELALGRRWRLGRSLRGRYTRAIVLPGSLKSALIPYWAGIPRRTGYRGEHRYGLINDMRTLDRAQLPMTVQRFVALGKETSAPMPEPLPRPRLQTSRDNRERLVARLRLDLLRPAIAFMPGAEYGPAKQWPLAHFTQLARELVAQGRQVWVLGSARDAAAGETIATEAGTGVRNFCGQTHLEDAVDLLGLAHACVTNDSGLMHIAAALDVPAIALFGSTSAQHTPPLSTRAQVLNLGLDCSPCFKRTCPLGHTRCLVDIRPEHVLAQLSRIADD